jgi:hypothetical protein
MRLLAFGLPTAFMGCGLPLPIDPDAGITVDVIDGVDTDIDTDVAGEPPTTPFISIQPPMPSTMDPLVARIDVASYDPDGNDITYLYTWFLNGKEFNVDGANTVPAEATGRDQVWQLQVQVDDGSQLSGVAEATTTVVNSRPELTSASISPLNPTSVDDLTALPVGYFDADGDPEDYDVSWYVNGSVTTVGDLALPADNFGRNDSIYVTLTPRDPYVTGYLRATPPITVANASPTFTGAWITPSDPSSQEDLTIVTHGWLDADGDLASYHYQWRVNGTDLTGQTSTTLSTNYIVKGDEVACTVTAWDGWVNGTVVVADVVTVGNAPPSATGVSIEPNSPSTMEDLTATFTGWSDADLDAPAGAWRWEVNGKDVKKATTEVLEASKFQKGDEVVAFGTPNDGTDTGAEVSGSATVVNSEPSISSVSIEPWSLFEGDLTAVITGWNDADEDAESYAYIWYVNSAEAGTDATLSDTLFTTADTIYVVATPNDGDVDGATVASDLLADEDPPSVTSTDPEDQGELTLDGTVTWEFNEPIDTAAVSTSAAYIDGIDGSVSFTEDSVTFTPDELLSCRDYTATITDHIEDLAGLPLDNPGSISFTAAHDLTWEVLTDVKGTDLDPPITHNASTWDYGISESEIFTVNGWYTEGSAGGLASDVYKNFGGSSTLDNEALLQVHLVPAEEPDAIFDIWDDGVVDLGVTLATRAQSPGPDGRAGTVSAMPSYHYLINGTDPDAYRYGFENNVLLVYPSMQSYQYGSVDLLPYMSPYYLLMDGLHSGVGETLTAVAMAGSAVHPELQARLRGDGLWAATMMWLLKQEVASSYHHPDAHRGGYSQAEVQALVSVMAERAHAMDHIPPVPVLEVDSATGGGDHSESTWAFFATVDDTNGPLVVELDAGDSVLDGDACHGGYQWDVLRGDVGVVVEDLTGDGDRVRITIPYQAGGGRTDVMMTVNDGLYWGFPAYISVDHGI